MTDLLNNLLIILVAIVAMYLVLRIVTELLDTIWRK